MPKWVTELPGKWVCDGTSGGPQGLIEIVHQDERSAKCFGRWHGTKGGPAGFEGRFVNPHTIKGQWFDSDAQLYDRDRLNITIEISNGEVTVKASLKDGSVSEWTARRPYIARDGGKLTIPSGGNNEVFWRLAQPTSPRRPEWLEEKRKQMLQATLQATGGVTTKDLKSNDGAITYIPPMAITEPFDDGAARRIYDNSPRFRGRQMYASLNIIGQPMTVPPSPSFPYLPRPYMTISDVARVLRLEKEKQEAALPAGLKGRKKFRPSSACGPRRPEVDLYLSAVDGLKVSETELTKLQKVAAEQGGFAELPRRPASAGVRGAPETKVVKGSDGKLQVVFAKRGMVAAAKKEVRPLPIPEYLGEDYDGPRLSAREEAAKERAKMGDRRPFTPSGPRLVFETTISTSSNSGADTPKAKDDNKSGASSPRSPRPQSAGGADSSRKLFSPYLPTQASERPSAAERAASKWRDYPQYIPSPYIVFPEGGMNLLRAPTPPVPTLESIKGPGGGMSSRPQSPRGPRHSEAAATASGVETPRSPRPMSAGANTNGAGGDRALWKPGAAPAASSFRPVTSVATHHINMRRSSKSGGSALMLDSSAAMMMAPPHSPLRATATMASASSAGNTGASITAPRSGTGMDQLSPLVSVASRSRPQSAAPGGRSESVGAGGSSASGGGQGGQTGYSNYHQSVSSAASSASPSRRPSVTVMGGGGGANPQESFSRAQSPTAGAVSPMPMRQERPSITGALGLTFGGAIAGQQTPLRMPSVSMSGGGGGVGSGAAAMAVASPSVSPAKQRPSSALPVLSRSRNSNAAGGGGGGGGEGFSVTFAANA